MKKIILKIFIWLFVFVPYMSYGVQPSNGVTKPTVKKYFGTVLDKETNEPIELVNIAVVGTTEGCTTNVNGVFGGEVECKLSSNIVGLSFVGYEPKTNVSLIEGQENIIYLVPAEQQLDEVTIVPDEDTSCVDTDAYIAKGVYKRIDGNLVCEPIECVGTYTIEDGKCVAKIESPKECEIPAHATKVSEYPECSIDACERGWKPSENKTVCVEEQKKKPEPKDTRTDEEKEADLKEKKDAYDKAQEKEKSWENRALTAGTTAVTGVGGMELAQGWAERNADKDAEEDMAKYLATMKCTYGNGQLVKFGSDPVELPSGDYENLNKYKALAGKLKERKELLGMMPGIESEVILDKSDMGLYDDENVGITDDGYGSVYRAMAKNSEEDQTKLDEDAKKSKTRMYAGGAAAAVGVAGGLVGNSLINGKLGEKIADNRKNKDVISKLKQGFSSVGFKNFDDLKWDNVDLKQISSFVDKIDFNAISKDYDGKDITKILNTGNDESFMSTFRDILGGQNSNLFNTQK